MKTKIEGILLSKTPYQERHVVGKLLLRSGKRISVVFFGGQGGGSKKRSSVLEVGHMLSIELSRSKSTSSMYQAKETSLLWAHKNIRLNHKAFYLMCFYLEMIAKLSLEDNLHDEHHDFDESTLGLFRVLSNALFYLDKALDEKKFNEVSELVVFLSKVAIETGVFPDIRACIVSGISLDQVESVVLLAEQGGFADLSCLDVNEKRMFNTDDRALLISMKKIANLKYNELDNFDFLSLDHVKSLLSFLCFQHHIERRDLKSLGLLL